MFFLEFLTVKITIEFMFAGINMFWARLRKKAQEKLALTGLLCIGSPEPIERNPFNCVRLSSVSECPGSIEHNQTD